jgi:hypothetical protein
MFEIIQDTGTQDEKYGSQTWIWNAGDRKERWNWGHRILAGCTNLNKRTRLIRRNNDILENLKADNTENTYF